MRIHSLILAALVSFGAALGRAENLLQDPGFETGTDNQAFDAAWEKWGNVFHELVTPRSGHWSCKLFGTFTGELNHSGIQQDVPVEAGGRYRGSIYLRHNADDQLQGQNRIWLRLAFRDAAGHTLQEKDTTSLSASDTTDRYALYETEPVTAPAGTTSLRYIIFFEQQSDNAAGAVFCDDAALEKLP